ncbi:Uncharacterised protein [uncultured archaeon]|nr:Uncharacterised protein [uncultured archaeon]
MRILLPTAEGAVGRLENLNCMHNDFLPMDVVNGRKAWKPYFHDFHNMRFIISSLAFLASTMPLVWRISCPTRKFRDFSSPFL